VIRFHLDEHVDHDIARGLRLRGIDVTTTTDAGLLGSNDLDQLAYALRDNRVLITNDAGFLKRARSGVTHAGIAYCAPGSRSIGDIVRYLCLMHDCMSDDEMRDRVEYL
jgi:uncharacterized protein with PIN domain